MNMTMNKALEDLTIEQVSAAADINTEKYIPPCKRYRQAGIHRRRRLGAEGTEREPDPVTRGLTYEPYD